MPGKILPIEGLHQVGVIKDTPAVSLPPNAFTDARNVRFRDGSVHKMEGEHTIFGSLTNIRYVIWWPNPNRADNQSGYFIIIQDNGTNDVAYLYQPADNTMSSFKHDGMDTTTPVAIGTFSREGNWQHTFFQGGFAVVINNGLDVPHYILDGDGNDDIQVVPNFAELPGWESYETNELILSDTYMDGVHSPTFDLGQLVDFDVNEVVITVGTFTSVIASMNGRVVAIYNDMGDATAVEVATDTTSNTTTATFSVPANIDNQLVTIAIRSREMVEVRAGVVRSFGDFLVAGNLVERDSMNRVVRALPGVVRTSDVAVPGAIPANWNPFAAGVSTADEFTLATSGVIQDMVELQGNLYIYSNNSIAVLRRTENAQVPFSSDILTDSWGCQTTDAVIEFDGKHLVVGSHDIYVFGGHPGSIQSISDGRIREFFFNNLSQPYYDSMFIVRYQRRDEIWICYPDSNSLEGECTVAAVWNYRLNNWTFRDLNYVHSGVIAPVPGAGIPLVTVTVNGTTSTDDGLPTTSWLLDFTDNPAGLNNFQVVADSSTLSVQNSSILNPVINISAEGTTSFNFPDETFVNTAVTTAFTKVNTNTAWGFTLDNVGATTFRSFDSAVTMDNGVPVEVGMEVINADGDINAVPHYGFLGINNQAAALRVGQDSLDHVFFEAMARGGRDMFVGFIECDADGNVASGARQYLVDVRESNRIRLMGDW